ncbi:hypothetical protein OSB04_015177 [Centaurea solstitialis]|uniref:Uncharacterized protein n=1 Tax=Centaurea solstitialis TaxID=347529 RepID=A0AA38W8P4_9ASTR|nr:hypothetical protein OSB04_015177 [Centaurea solstitialis]
MKEHEDCDMVTVEKSSVIVEKVVTGERDEGEDMMVDVVGADAVDLDRKADSVRLVEKRMNETESRDLNMDTKEEVAGSGEKEDVCHVSAGTSVLASEKVEVVEKVEVSVKEERLETSIEVRDSEKGLILEQNVESVEVVKECLQKEIETSDLNTDTEEAAVVTGEDVRRDSVGSGGLAFKKVEVTVVEESLNTSLEVRKDVLLQGNDDATGCGSLVRDSKESSIGGGDNVVIDGKDLTERGSTKEERVESVEEVAEGDRVLDRKSKKEAEVSDSSKIAESLEVDTKVVEDEAEKSVSDNNQISSTELVNVEANEVAGKSKEESPHPTMEVTTDGPQGNESVDPRFVGGENDSIDKEEESDRGLPNEIKEQPMECDQQVAGGNRVVGEKSQKNPKQWIPQRSQSVRRNKSRGGLALTTKDEAQDGVSVDPSSVSADNRSSTIEVVNSATSEGEVIPQADQAEVITNDAQILENGTAVGNPELGIQFGREDAVIDIEKTENGSVAEDEEIVEQHSECVQEAVHEDGAMDEKTEKVDEVLDSSKIPESLTRANLVQEEVLTSRIEAQNSDSVGQKIVSLAENSDHRAEVDPTEITTTANKVIKTKPKTEILRCT